MPPWSQARAKALERQRKHGFAHLPSEALALVHATEPGAGCDRSHGAERVGTDRLRTDRIALMLDDQVELSCVGRPGPPAPPMVLHEPRSNAGLDMVDQAIPKGISSGGQIPALATAKRRTTSSSVGRRKTRRSLRIRNAKSGQSASRPAVMSGRRYTPPMGAVETMEDFFEKLNAGDREAAVALMDERAEMRVHVGDSVQTLRGVERVGGWFLRGDQGLRMIPGDIRDTGNTYEADLLVVRPGAQSQHIDATFRVEAGKITAINIAPR